MPYGDAVSKEEKHYRLSRARMVTDGAFGKLGSIFRVLHRRCEVSKEPVKRMGFRHSCFAQHLFYNRRLYFYYNRRLYKSFYFSKRRPDKGSKNKEKKGPRRNCFNSSSYWNQKNCVSDSSARSIRQALTKDFWEKERELLLRITVFLT